MSALKRIFVFLAAAALVLAGLPAVSSAADSLKIVGSTTVYPIAEDAVKLFKAQKPDAKIDLSAGGSSVGVKAIMDGIADIGNSSRPLSSKEMDAAKAKNLKIDVHVVAYDCIAPIVHPANPVADLTIAQLHDIYTGKITNWKDVGGKDQNIIVVSREDNSGTYDTWDHFVMKKKPVAAAALKQQSNPGVRAYVSKTPKAIGYVGYGFAKEKSIKAIKVNGIDANPEMAIKFLKSKGQEGYPISRELYMLTAGELKGVKKDFMEFVLGPKGQDIAERAGFIRVK